jgi:hypothetical protein
MLLPVQDFLVASDHPASIERRLRDGALAQSDQQIPGQVRGQAALPRHPRSWDRQRHSQPGRGRAQRPGRGYRLESQGAFLCNFNARLNGIDNIEMLMGDGFQPVAGRTFDLILSNPPFLHHPQLDYMFCDNSMELDQLCRRLVKEAPAFLNEGGYMQMLCEWAQVNDQPWEERIAEWLEGTGCDAWVMKGLTQYPEEYAQHRIRETTQDTGRDRSCTRAIWLITAVAVCRRSTMA